MSSRTIKKLLLSLIVVGAIGSFTARGTYALLNGEDSNPNNSITTGTILMNDHVTADCNSQNGTSNTNFGCDAIFSSGSLSPISSAAEPPLPSSSTYASGIVQITNTGSLPATLKVAMASTQVVSAGPPVVLKSACTYATTSGYTNPAGYTAVNPCCPGLASGLTPGGSNGACSTGSLDLFIQECSTSNCSSTLSSCVYPVSTSAACTFQNDSFENFWSSYYDTSHYLSLGSLAVGATRYFQVAVAEPSNASNGLQGQTATFILHWHLE